MSWRTVAAMESDEESDATQEGQELHGNPKLDSSARFGVSRELN